MFVITCIITSMARNSLLCADVPLRNYSLTLKILATDIETSTGLNTHAHAHRRHGYRYLNISSSGTQSFAFTGGMPVSDFSGLK